MMACTIIFVKIAESGLRPYFCGWSSEKRCKEVKFERLLI